MYATLDGFTNASSFTGAEGVWTSSQSFGIDFLSGTQLTINILSNVPEFGAVANGINASISLARGDYKGAALYAGAAGLSAIGVPGAGAGVKAIEAAEAIAAAEEISQGSVLIDEAAQEIASAQKLDSQTGSYTNVHASGKTYSGKCDELRAQMSARRVARVNKDPHVSTDFTTASSHREAFKQESRRIDANGGVRSSSNCNKIESPGRRFRIQDGEIDH